MATNAFFRNIDNTNEQNLIDDLVIESIQIYGLDVKFVTRLHSNVDKILNEDDLPTFDNYYQSGSLQVCDMRCELAEYSGETFNTGYYEIDNYFEDIDTSANTVTTLTNLANTDPISQNVFFESQGDDIIDFSEMDPFSENISIQDS